MASSLNSNNSAVVGGVLEGVDVSAMGPGHRLRDARKAVNLDQSDIAKQLNLTMTVVNSLERDEYEDMPPSVFVRGYLRSYALMVGLEPSAVVAMYDALVGIDQEADPFRSLPLGLAPQPKAGRGRLLIIVAAVVVVIAVAAWVMTSGVLDKDMPALSEAPAAVEESVQLVESDLSSGVLVAEDGNAAEIIPQTPQQEPVAAEPTLAPLQNEAQLLHDIINPTPIVSADLTSESETGGVQALADGADSGALSAVSEPAVVEAIEPVDSNEAVLELVFSGKCWTTVSDATGKRLAFGVMNAGVTRTLRGVPPYKVTLGQSDAVIVKYNGELFDHQAFSQGKIARFSIGASTQ